MRLGTPKQRTEQAIIVVRNSQRALLGAATCIVALALVWTGVRFLTKSQYFAIVEVRMLGNTRLSNQALQSMLPFAVGDNIFTTSISDITNSLERLPWIARVTAARRLPNQIDIAIEERVPVAIAVVDQRYLIDAQGVAFMRAPQAAADQSLPIITGVTRELVKASPTVVSHQFREAIAVLSSWRRQASRPTVSEVMIIDDSYAVRAGRTMIHLGPFSTLDTRLLAFDTAWAALSATEQQSATTIQLDQLNDTVTVAFAEQVEN
jgi:cell division septal protein FtsQ